MRPPFCGELFVVSEVPVSRYNLTLASRTDHLSSNSLPPHKAIVAHPIASFNSTPLACSRATTNQKSRPGKSQVRQRASGSGLRIRDHRRTQDGLWARREIEVPIFSSCY